MFCKVCGKEVDNDSQFCPFCGADLRSEIEEVENAEQEPVKSSKGPWNAFALVGFILGIVSFVGSFVIIGMEIAIPGIIFSALGKKSEDENKKAKASKGLKLSIAALIIGIVMSIILGIVIGALIASGAISEEEVQEFLKLFGVSGVTFG